MSSKVANRIVAPVATVSLLLLVVGVAGAWYVHRLQIGFSRLLDRNVASIRAAEELELHVREMRYEIARFTDSEQHGDLDQTLHYRDGVQRWLHEAARLAVTPKELELIMNIQRDLTPMLAELAECEKAQSLPPHLAHQILDGPLFNLVLLNAREYLDLNERELEASNKQSKELSNRLTLALLMLGTCGSVAGLVAGYGIARGVSRSIYQLSLPVRDVAGKLSEVVKPVTLSADPQMEDLEYVLKTISTEVTTVIAQLHESHRAVMRADQLAALGQLAAGLAHELRNPLMCMKVLVQSARNRPSSLDDTDLQVMDQEICRLEQLLQGFMDFARPTELVMRAVDLRQIVEQTVTLLAAKTERQRVHIAVNIIGEDLVIDGDEVQLRQLLLNLLLNALDALPMGGDVRIEVEEVKAATAPRAVELRVIDDGCGLPDLSQEKIFEPFFSTKPTGLGLGLATCQRIVESHGGAIFAFDGTPVGATFVVRLPATSNQ